MMISIVTFVKVTISREPNRRPSRVGLGSTSQVKCWQLKPLQIFLQTRNGLGYKAKDNLELEVCLANPHMIATAKCKLPLDLCLENPEWLPLVGCSGEGYPRQVCLDFPNLITSPACQGQNCTSSVLSSFTPLSPFYLLSHLDESSPPAHHSVFGAFSLEICLRFPSLLPKPACQGQSSKLCSLQGGGKSHVLKLFDLSTFFDSCSGWLRGNVV